MSRYGWSSQPEREQLSPFNATQNRGGVPSVTDQDFEYITSEDLQNQGVDSQHAYDYDPRASNHHFARPGPALESTLEIPDDDVLIIKHGRTEYREYFPAYSIGDGKLLVGDLRDRIQLIMKLSDKRTERVRMLYKGKQLKADKEPVCKYGVKNNSAVLVVLPDPALDDASDSGDEIVVVENDDERLRPSKSRSIRRKERGPRDSNPSGLDVPHADEDRRGGPTSRGQSPASGVSAASASSAVPGGPVDKLNTIASHFTTVLLPQCEQFTAAPPADPKKKADDHRKLSETVMQQVILKLDAVETGGEEQARARRKELVKQVQEVLKGMDGRM